MNSESSYKSINALRKKEMKPVLLCQSFWAVGMDLVWVSLGTIVFFDKTCFGNTVFAAVRDEAVET